MYNFFKNMFGSKKEETSENTLLAVATGKVVPLAKVPDKMFADKLIGDGIAIFPEDDIIGAPVDGTITMIFKTKHAFAMTLDNGIELLVHIGIDTVSLNGSGFEKLIEEGSTVKAGTPIIKIDRKLITENNLSIVTPILITNMDIIQSISVTEEENSILGETKILSYKLK